MAKVSTIFAVILVVIVILIGTTVGILFVLPKVHSGGPSTGPSQTSFETTSSTTSTTTTTMPSSFSTTSSQSSTTSTSSSATNYALQLLQSGSGPLQTSPMNTSVPNHGCPSGYNGYCLPDDGPCCGGNNSNVYNYSDNANLWVFQGDIEPGLAWIHDSLGLTMNDQTCPPGYTHDIDACTPHSELDEGFDDTSVYGDLKSIAIGATVFSIEASMPYHDYYPSCILDTGHGNPNGCSYESNYYQLFPYLSPYDVATFGYDYNSNLIIVSVAEICNANPCTSSSLLMLAYTSSGGVSIDKVLASVIVNPYTPTHRLTIATDGSSYVYLYVDNTLLYYNTTMPIPIGPGGGIEISERTSINNETNVVTWSNFTAYSSPFITVNGLSSGMSVLVSGPDGFQEMGNATSGGIVVLSVASQPTDLTVSVQYGGKTIATYSETVSAGAELGLYVIT